MERGSERGAERAGPPLRSEIIDVSKIDPADLAELPGEVLRRAIERVCRETARETTAYQRFNASI
ncbi:FxSxx-COOH cyclophane-containing RiPP peptide [Actinomadura roseirufa]|uniref:FxSxx-COOH cyclophane-containing RiPP peptide n=1 Tax=Actinomadura roseirufa TaxID=2094049 RepID=UPI00104186B3|nr:FxSxx-COOH cyclophane-containing RiPP peptide [Actinomadura roseirufa]